MGALVWLAVPGMAQDRGLSFNFHIGGGIGIPVSSTTKFFRPSGTFQLGGGPNLTKHNSFVLEAMWQGLPANRSSVAVVNSLIGAELGNTESTFNNLYALTANYMYHIEGHRYGLYVIGGGGWYDRSVQNSNDTASHDVSSGGVNVGGGLTIGLGRAADYARFYMEARYHYSPLGGRVATHSVPVTFGIRW